jgi:DNA-binding IclR family transcriptional regulator
MSPCSGAIVVNVSTPAVVKFSSLTIPQADALGRVLDLVKAMAVGTVSTEDLAYEIDCVPRQARYYRLAAVQLGLVRRIARDDYALTPSGHKLVAASGERRQQICILREAALTNPALRATYDRVSLPETTRESLASWLVEQSGLNASTASRRLTTMLSWLTTLGLVRVEGERLSVVLHG